ncbi:MAG: isopentenyl-diphosphate Delta-isomerase [Sediminibacterium sp.]|nr:isopentenyl-diphosphate Delta-isomerase [Sediminibacterium sp.]
MEEYVILVDETDKELGVMEKMEAHQKGVLHRAFSVFIFNTNGEMLLQQRALSKYHSAGLWTNTCCSHPRPGENVADAALRRLNEEMGLSVPLAMKTTFIYKAAFDNQLTEHELDYIFTGISTTDPQINPEEVNAFKWLSPHQVQEAIKAAPHQFTAWFKIAMEQFFAIAQA